MATMNPQTEETLRQVFKAGNRLMVLLFRLGLGSFGNRPQTSQVMVLVHSGRKTGRRRLTPVNYALVDGDVYCTAGFGAKSDWYRNVKAERHVEMWLRDGWWAGLAEEVAADDPQRQALMREVLIASGFAAPLLAGIHPKTLDEAKLAELTATYRLIRIRRSGARTGPGGPGDLAWVWPAATFSLLIWLGLCWRRRKQAENGD